MARPGINFASSWAALALALCAGRAEAADGLAPDEALRAAVQFAAGRQSVQGSDARVPAGELLVDLTVNGVRQPDVVTVEVLDDGSVAVPIDVWRAARLRAGDTIRLRDGRDAVRLGTVPGVAYRLDAARLLLALDASASAFEASHIDARPRNAPSLSRTGTGAYIDYDISVTAIDDGTVTWGGRARAVLFSSAGTLVSGTVLRGANRGSGPRVEAIRTETWFQRDLPGRRESLVIGDAISGASAWSRQVRFGGVRIARNFALAPDLITYPLPALTGSAALPSTIDVLVSGQSVQRGIPVVPGPFALRNVPTITGDGRVNLIVRDLAGIETVITRDFYLSPALLAVGLSDYSFEAGALRRRFGEANFAYGPAFIAGGWRQGVTSALTVGGRVELQGARQAAGVEVDATVGSFAAVRGAVGWAWTAADDFGPRREGGRYLVGIDRQAPAYGVFAQAEWQDNGFTPFGRIGPERLMRSRIQTGANARFGPALNLGVRYVDQRWRDGEENRLIAATASLRLPGRFTLSAYATHRVDRTGGWSVGLSLTRSFRGLTTARLAADRDQDGNWTETLSTRRSPPLGPGLGWQVEARNGADRSLRGGIIANADFGQFAAEGYVDDHSSALRLGARGSIGWLADTAFAAREIGDRAFAVVQLDGLDGVSVSRSNQPVATTGKRGLAVVTGLLPYQTNRIAVDPGELPLDVTIGDTATEAVPYARTGLVVKFPVHRSRNALAVLLQGQSTPVPLGARASLHGGGEFVVGRGGEVYVSDLGAENVLDVKWEGHACRVRLPALPSGEAEPRLPPVLCEVQ